MWIAAERIIAGATIELSPVDTLWQFMAMWLLCTGLNLKVCTNSVSVHYFLVHLVMALRQVK